MKTEKEIRDRISDICGIVSDFAEEYNEELDSLYKQLKVLKNG